MELESLNNIYNNSNNHLIKKNDNNKKLSKLKESNSERYQKEFVYLIQEIEKRKKDFPKIVQIRVNKWIRKFAEVCGNLEWEKNRNLHAIFLLDNILNNSFEEPYDKQPKDEHLPIISKTLVKSKLSKRFLDLVGIIDLRSKKLDNSNLDNDIKDSNIPNYIDYNNKDFNENLSSMNANNNNNQNIQNNSNIKNDQERTNIHNNIDLDLETKNYNDSILKQYDQNNLLNQENNLTNFRVNFYNKEKHFPNNSISNKNTSNIQVRSSSHNNNSSDISKKQPYYSKNDTNYISKFCLPYISYEELKKYSPQEISKLIKVSCI